MTTGDVAAIVLAAGRGSRFGSEPKLLAEFGGKPLVRHVAEAAARSTARSVIVVTGFHAGEVDEALAGLSVQIVWNSSFAEGMATSLKSGFTALPPGIGGAVILLGDMPLVTAPLIDILIAAWQTTRPPALIPTFGGQRGNPVILSHSLRPSIESLTGDRGAATILGISSDVIEWPVDDPAILRDVDTPATLSEMRQRIAFREWSGRA